MSRATVVLLPGFNGRADQPILVRLEQRLAPLGFDALRLAPPPLKLSPELTLHVEWLHAELAAVKAPLVLVGRSFGGRLAIRLAARRALAALVLLGFPVRPPRRPRPLDEAALQALGCPTLIVQGTKDELGPLPVLRRVIDGVPGLELEPIKGAGHGFGAREKGALDVAAAWLDRTVRRR